MEKRSKEFKQGDIVFLDFDPTKGHEQKGKRPAVIVSNEEFGKFTGLHIVCPITNNTKNFPTHVNLDTRTKVTGSILCEHLKSLDLIARHAEYKESIPEDILEEVMDIINACF